MKYLNLIEELIPEELPDGYFPTPFYRGFKDILPNNKKFLELEVRQNRKPRDSSSTFHNILNEVIEYDTGIGNVRSRCIFATNETGSAPGYGAVYKVYFPLNTIVVWYPGVEDVVTARSKIIAYKKEIDNKSSNPPNKLFHSSLITEADFEQIGDDEMMFICDKYIVELNKNNSKSKWREFDLDRIYHKIDNEGIESIPNFILTNAVSLYNDPPKLINAMLQTPETIKALSEVYTIDYDTMISKYDLFKNSGLLMLWIKIMDWYDYQIPDKYLE